MRGAALAVLAISACCAACSAMAASEGPAAAETEVEAVGLRSIAGWLKARGTEGFLGAGVARALGLGGERLAARQRGFRNASVLRVAQLLPDESMLFMVQSADGEVFFYHSGARGGLRRALLSLPQGSVVLPLDGAQAQANFRSEVMYWENRAADQ